MSPRLSNKEEYRKSYPETRKWLNQCVVCQTEGYKPELPVKVYPGELAENIRKYWQILEVDEISICKNCQLDAK